MRRNDGIGSVMKLRTLRGGRAMAAGAQVVEDARIRGSKEAVASMDGGLFCHSAALGDLDGEHRRAWNVDKVSTDALVEVMIGVKRLCRQPHYGASSSEVLPRRLGSINPVRLSLNPTDVLHCFDFRDAFQT